jgi:hypothetical protein
MINLDHLRPINEFVKTDDEDQPSLVLELENGLRFYGQWDSDSGYFFVWELLFEPETEEQEYFVKNMELPGRLYSKVVKFNYV